jgi:hypothetical protein
MRNVIGEIAGRPNAKPLEGVGPAFPHALEKLDRRFRRDAVSEMRTAIGHLAMQ